MKAWEVTFDNYVDYIDDNSTTDYVFANNSSEAKKEVASGGTVLNPYAYDDAQDYGVFIYRY